MPRLRRVSSPGRGGTRPIERGNKAFNKGCPSASSTEELGKAEYWTDRIIRSDI